MGGVKVGKLARDFAFAFDEFLALFGRGGAGLRPLAAKGLEVELHLRGLLFQFIRLRNVVEQFGGSRNLGGERRQFFRDEGVGENPIERVVVFGWNWIELVVVAPGACDGQAEKCLGRHVNPVADDVVHPSFELRSKGEEPERGERRLVERWIDFVFLRVFDGGDDRFVRRELVDDELVVGFVLVERIDHPVAIGPRKRKAWVGVLLLRRFALRVGKTGHIEPVATPPFPVVRRGEQAVDDARKGVGPGVGEEIVDLLRGRRQSDEVERNPADQRAFVRGCIGREAVRIELREHKRINRGADPGRVADRRNFGLFHRLKRPVRLAHAAIRGRTAFRD